jgi:predicted nuclease of predicted toxin-antitoxin system
VKLLFDQNISPKIIKKIPSELLECQQVRFVGLEDKSDSEIFEFAKIEGFALVTFDADFVDLNALRGTPPKIIYLNTGNLTTLKVSDLILNNLLSIQNYLNSETDDILELIKAP